MVTVRQTVNAGSMLKLFVAPVAMLGTGRLWEGRQDRRTGGSSHSAESDGSFQE